MKTRSVRDQARGWSAEQFADLEAAGARAPQSAVAVSRIEGLGGGSRGVKGEMKSGVQTPTEDSC